MLVSPRASLVLTPSDYIDLVGSGGDNGSASYSFENLKIGETKSVDIKIRVSPPSDATGDGTAQTVPVFRGSTQWIDPQYSYFEWVDPSGRQHRDPVPQRGFDIDLPTRTRAPGG